jgi:hypothetical protein
LQGPDRPTRADSGLAARLLEGVRWKKEQQIADGVDAECEIASDLETRRSGSVCCGVEVDETEPPTQVRSVRRRSC